MSYNVAVGDTDSHTKESGVKEERKTKLQVDRLVFGTVASRCGSSSLETECLFARGVGVLACNGTQEWHARIHDRGARVVFYATRAARI